MAYYNCMTWNFRKLISPPFQCTSITNRVLRLFDHVLRLITTVWPEMSENSYLRHFSAQVSQIVVLSLFDRFTAYYNCMTWNVRKLTSPPFQCTSITNRVLRLFDHFTAYYNCMTWNVRKLIFATSVHKYQISFSKLIWPSITTVFVTKLIFTFQCTGMRFITTVWPEMSENSYLHHFSAQVSQIVFFAYLTILRIITTVWPEMSENSHLHHLSAQVSQIVFFAYLTVLRFITTVWFEMSENSYLRHFSAHVSQIVFLTYLTILRLITTVWPEMSENSYLHHFSAQVTQIVFFAYLTVLRLITTL